MTTSGPALVVAGENIDTDALFPGAFLNIEDEREMAKHLFAGLVDQSLRARLTPGTVLVVGENFGMGSSREQVPIAMKGAGVVAVLGESFARIFHRNCINLGLLAVSCKPAAKAAKDGSIVVIDSGEGKVSVDGTMFGMPPMPKFVLNLISAGGLVAWTREQVTEGGGDG